MRYSANGWAAHFEPSPTCPSVRVRGPCSLRRPRERNQPGRGQRPQLRLEQRCCECGYGRRQPCRHYGLSKRQCFGDHGLGGKRRRTMQNGSTVELRPVVRSRHRLRLRPRGFQRMQPVLPLRGERGGQRSGSGPLQRGSLASACRGNSKHVHLSRASAKHTRAVLPERDVRIGTMGSRRGCGGGPRCERGLRCRSRNVRYQEPLQRPPAAVVLQRAMV